MYNRIYKFLNINNIIYSLQFDFRQHYSTSYALLNLAKAIMKALDGGNFACGIFVELQKAFDTVDHRHSVEQIISLQNTWIRKQMV